MNRTNIEYLDYTWNPIAMRCDPVSAGCKNCWHIKMANRLGNNPVIPPEAQKGYRGEAVYLIEDRLDEPLKLKVSSVIGVQFMGDLFHEKVPELFIDQVMGVPMLCPQHTFIFLTKRSERMLDYIKGSSREMFSAKNIFCGVSIEDQKTADERIPILLHVPAAKRFVSVEPLLEEITLTMLHFSSITNIDVLRGLHGVGFPHASCNKLDLVIAGAETGPRARPMDLAWARSLRDQCKVAGVPFFMKEISQVFNGPHTPIPDDLMIREWPDKKTLTGG